MPIEILLEKRHTLHLVLAAQSAGGVALVHDVFCAFSIKK
jgi:hypothetical protein